FPKPAGMLLAHFSWHPPPYKLGRSHIAHSLIWDNPQHSLQAALLPRCNRTSSPSDSRRTQSLPVYPIRGLPSEIPGTYSSSPLDRCAPYRAVQEIAAMVCESIEEGQKKMDPTLD